MAHIKITFDIYDPRYRADPYSATCFEAGLETLKEAIDSAKEYGENNVIVRTVYERESGNVWRFVSATIEN